MGAAGKSLLLVNAKPMLLGIAEALMQGRVDYLMIVAHTQLLNKLPAMPANVRVIVNDDPQSAMIDSIRLALSAYERCQPIGGLDGVLVCPCDAAGLHAEDVRRCVEAFRETPNQIIIAAHENKRGHPMIFPAGLIPAVRSSLCDAGLNQLAKHHGPRVRQVACDSPGTIRNVNTPEDYNQLDHS